MFEPKYTITPKILENVKRIYLLIAEINRVKIPGEVQNVVKMHSEALSCHASAKLSGYQTPLDETYKILKSWPKQPNKNELAILNYRNAIQDLHIKLKNPRELKFTKNLFLDFHKLIVSYIDAKTGSFRSKDITWTNQETENTYTPPSYQAVPRLVEELTEFIQSNINTTESLILAGIIHKQIALIQPFENGNLRLARLFGQFPMFYTGLKNFDSLCIDNFYKENARQYFKKLDLTGDYSSKNDIDFSSWLEFFTDGIRKDLRRIQKDFKSTMTPKSELQRFYQQILRYIDNYGFITDSNYAQISNRAKSTRIRDFNKLIEMGIIERFGKGKGIYYKRKWGTSSSTGSNVSIAKKKKRK